MSDYKYFVIPYTSLPETPAYTVWYATFATERPVVEPGVEPPMVVGITTEDVLPEGATLIGSTYKDPRVPPPPPPGKALDSTIYQQSFEAWISARRSFRLDEDEEPQRVTARR